MGKTATSRKTPTAGAAPANRRAPRNAGSLTSRIYERLRADILSCALPPGAEVSETELATRFEVSKTPVREALATLRSEGFVKTFPRRGYQIVPITFADMNELFDVRTIVEAGAAELACRRITDGELDQLSRLADVVYDRQEQPSLKRFIQANKDFHAAIGQASGNERLHQLVLKQIDELERFFYLGARLRDINQETQNDHHEIVEVLRSRDPVAARTIMIKHNDVTRRGLFERLATAQGFSRVTL